MGDDRISTYNSVMYKEFWPWSDEWLCRFPTFRGLFSTASHSQTPQFRRQVRTDSLCVSNAFTQDSISRS